MGNPRIKVFITETPYIHSENTYKTYLAQCNHFAGRCMANGIKYADEAYEEVPEYGKWMVEKGMSAWTVQTPICAIAKAYGVSTKAFGFTPPKRERMAVKLSRYAAERDKHFSRKNNGLLVVFARCTGLRRHELENLRGTQLILDQDGRFRLFQIKG